MISKNIEKYVVILSIFFLLIIFHYYLIPNGKKLYYYYKLKNFKSTQGIITVATYRKLRVYSKHGGPSYYKYLPVIQFKYNVNGKNYVSNNFPTIVMYSDEIKEFLKKFSENKKITVYYNPQNPSEAFLFIKKEKPNFINLIIFSLIAVILLYRVIIFFLKKDA